MKDILADVLFLAGSALFCTGMFCGTKKKITGVLLISDIIGAIKYLLVGGRSGFINQACMIGKDASYSVFNSEKATAFFIGLRIVMLLVFYQNILTLAFVAGEILHGLAILKGRVSHVRMAVIFEQVIWVFYDYMSGGILWGALSFIVLIILCISTRYGKQEEKPDGHTA